MKNTKFIIAFIIFIVLLSGALFIWLERRAGVMMNKQTTVPLGRPISNSDTNVMPTGSSISPAKNNNALAPIGTLLITSSVPSVKLSQSFTVNLALSAPGKKIIGSDVILKYDPTVLRADQIVEGTTFEIYPRKDINPKGTVSITAFRSKTTSPLSSDLAVASVKFTALKKGTAQIIIDYIPGSTSHSTIVEAGTSKNILGAALPITVVVE